MASYRRISSTSRPANICSGVAKPFHSQPQFDFVFSHDDTSQEVGLPVVFGKQVSTWQSLVEEVQGHVYNCPCQIGNHTNFLVQLGSDHEGNGSHLKHSGIN